MSDPADPNSQDYQPSYTGPDYDIGAVGPAGSGTQFGADLYQLYKAGRLKFPELARQYYEFTLEVHGTHEASESAFDTAGRIERHHRLWMELRDELQRLLGETSTTMADTGQALVEIADSYVRTDEEAVREFNRLLDAHEDDYQHVPRTPPEPPRPEDYPPEPVESYPNIPV